ncbi:uncharacterized protein [Apostichopus japonicus]|uniref:uncharacterized protein n=1 Tax=Stichopus japonicus TaxID=307972 RepID=UPI003AB64518
MAEQSPFFGSGSNSKGEVAPPSPNTGESGQAPVYHGTYEKKGQKYTLYTFIGAIIIMVLITFILCIVEGLKHPQGVLFFLLAISLIGFIFIELMVLRMIRSGDLDKEKAWFAYFMGACTIVEALFVNIVVLS